MSLALSNDPPVPATVKLGQGRRGLSGTVATVSAAASGGLGAAELERRLLEMGFVEGAPVELLHEGPIGRDPIVVRIGDTTVALRRADAEGIMVTPGHSEGASV